MPGNPCCCCSLETGVKVLAIYGITCSVFMIFGSLFIVSVSLTAVRFVDSFPVGIIALILAISSYIINIVLLIGAANRDAIKCKIWLIGSSTLYVIANVFALIIIAYDASAGEKKSFGSFHYYVFTGLQLCIGTVIQIYFLWVVHSFIKQIKNRQSPLEVSKLVAVHQYGQPIPGGQVQVMPYGGNPQSPSQNGQSGTRVQGGLAPSAPPPKC